MHKAAQAYLQTQVTTTSQGELLLLLYDGAIKFLTQAKERMAARDMAGKGVLISKALDVINELDSSLNAEKGGELADNLHKLYFYCSTRLLSANLKLDPNLIDEVIKVLSGLRGAYAQIVNTPEAQAAAADVAARQSPASTMPQRGAPVMPGLPRPPAGFAARAQANAAYGQTTPQAAPAAGVAFERPVMPPPAHVTPPAAQTGAPAAPGSRVAPDSPVAQGQTTPATTHGTLPFASPGGQAATAPAPSAAASATSAQAPQTGQAVPDGPGGQGVPGGFANKRLAASNLYRKLSQG